MNWTVLALTAVVGFFGGLWMARDHMPLNQSWGVAVISAVAFGTVFGLIA